MVEKLKPMIADDRYYFLSIVIMVAIISFGLGRFSVSTESSHDQVATESGAAVRLVESSELGDDSLTVPFAEVTATALVASKNGSRYYRQHCSGVARINEENRIYFPDEERARAAGYTRAAQCFD